MATKKQTPVDEKFERQDFDLFESLAAMDRKDYGYYDRLSEEQQKKFVPFMMTQWMSQVKDNGGVQGYYVRSVDYYANQHLFNENVMKHPKLQWMMLCASSPGLGSKRHQWVPQLSKAVRTLKEKAQNKEVYDYFSKIYPKANDSDLTAITDAYVTEQRKKVYIAKEYPDLKYSDVELLAQLVTEEEIESYERGKGN